MDRRVLSGAGVQAPWNGVLETVCSIATKLSRLDACEDGNVARWCRTPASSHNSQGVFEGGDNKTDMSIATPDRRAVFCGLRHQG